MTSTLVPPLRRLLGALAVTVLAAVLLAGGVALAALAFRAGLAAGRGPHALDELVGAAAAAVASALLAWWGTALLALVVTCVRSHEVVRGPGTVPGGSPRRAAALLAGTLPRPLSAVASLALGAVLVAGATVPASAHAPSTSRPAPTADATTQGVPPGLLHTLDPGWGTPGLLSRAAASTPEPRGAPPPVPRAGAQIAPPDNSPDNPPVTPPPAGPDAEPDDTSTAPRQWSPPRPPTRRAPSAALVVQQPRASAAATGDVVVRRGDTLWDLCARHLPAEATDAEIAREWPRWHAANLAVIGPDPDVLEPGQRLRPPAPTTTGAG